MHVSKYRWYLIDIDDDDDDDNDDNNDDNDDDDEIRAYLKAEVLSTFCSCYKYNLSSMVVIIECYKFNNLALVLTVWMRTRTNWCHRGLMLLSLINFTKCMIIAREHYDREKWQKMSNNLTTIQRWHTKKYKSRQGSSRIALVNSCGSAYQSTKH